jgi:copper chaperone CopZ
MDCAKEVKNTLSPVPGVVEVETDPAKKTAIVTVDASKFDSDSALQSLAAAHFENSTVIE